MRTTRSRTRAPEYGNSLADRCEPKFGQQALESRQGSAESAVVSGACQPRNTDARLARVHLPRMDVEPASDFAPLALTQRRADDAVGEKTEVRPAPGGQAQRTPLQGRRRNLRKAAGSTHHPVRIRPAARIPVARTSHWKQTGIVAIPFLDED